MANIAIVTSTSFGGCNEACFRAGLASSLGEQPQPTLLEPFQSYGNYNTNDLRELIRSAVNHDPTPDLIVAAGGLEMAQAAALELQGQDPKFVFLSGDALGENPVALAGGVNMNVPGEDTTRQTLLKETYPHVQDTSMYLVVNNNSPMWPNDAKNWPASRIARFFCDVANPTNNKQSIEADNHFIAEFHKLAQRKPTPTGLVISVDPYFRYWRTAFVIALAEKLPIPVCYPFQDFVDASDKTANKSNSIALNKPPLNNSSDAGDQTTAYFQLGKQAGKFIAGTGDVGVVRWNGSEWELQSDSWGSGKAAAVNPELGEVPKVEIEIEALKIRVKGGIDKAVLRELLAALRTART
jgi:hypothetical protein